jgi:uncharacterized membrane protein
MGRVIDAVVLLLYPVIVLGGLAYLGVRWTALILLVLTGRRFVASIFSDRSTSRIMIIQASLVVAIIGGAAALGSELVLRFAPFAVSLTFIALFAISLGGTPIIERFARLSRPDLPPDHVTYCRRLTRIWIVVLSLNSCMILFACLFGDTTLWTVLVGPVSYGFLGVVFAVEYVYRKWRFQEFDDRNYLDQMLKVVLHRKRTQ